MDEIQKHPDRLPVAPHLHDYGAAVSGFSWACAIAEVATPDGHVNIADRCVERHVRAGRGSRTAIRFLAAGAPAGVVDGEGRGGRPS